MGCCGHQTKGILANPVIVGDDTGELVLVEVVWPVLGLTRGRYVWVGGTGVTELIDNGFLVEVPS